MNKEDRPKYEEKLTEHENLELTSNPLSKSVDLMKRLSDYLGMGEPPAPPMDDMGMDDEGEEEPQGPTGLKSIQKLTGRLSQKIRSFEKEKGMDSQDIKYVLNSIISALELENLDEDDKDDIISKFDESDEYGEEGAGELDLGDEDMGMEDNMDMGMGGTPPPPPPSEGPMMESKSR